MRGVCRVSIGLTVGIAEVQEHQRTDEMGVCNDSVDLGDIARITFFQARAVMNDVVGIDHHAVSPSPDQARITRIVLGQRQEIVDVRLHLPGVGSHVRQVARQIGIVDRIVVVKRVGGAVYAVICAFQSRQFCEKRRSRAFADVLDLEETAASGRTNQQDRG